jgi:hypothetical protein
MAKKAKTIGDQLRDAIEHADATRYRLAQQSGVLESTICKFMAGAGLNLESMNRLCDVLGLELQPREQKGK